MAALTFLQKCYSYILRKFAMTIFAKKEHLLNLFCYFLNNLGRSHVDADQQQCPVSTLIINFLEEGGGGGGV